jgi:hypothetical protein
LYIFAVEAITFPNFNVDVLDTVREKYIIDLQPTATI